MVSVSPIDADLASSCDKKCGLRDRQREARDEAILQAAFAIIVENGYDALTMEAVASRVGISRQTLYHHFKSREDIALRAFLTLMEQAIATIESLDLSLPPIERLKSIVLWMFESRFQPTCAALVRVRHSIMPVKAHPDYQKAFERRAVVLAKIVQAAQESGDVRSDLPSRLIVQMLLGLISDASYEGLVERGQTTVPQVTEAIIDVFFSGIRP
jgi:AcrR family transcriptional regulator